MIRSLDQLAAYDDFNSNVAPTLQKAVTEKWSVERIYKEFGALLAARAITIALKEQDSGKALAAVKDIMDRSIGKAADKVETTHRLERMPDAELDKLLESLAGEDLLTTARAISDESTS